ncbi:DUF1656 domain-containing protein [Robbsia sp. Bb-Pol-6]|uniref:DUF1656 domain-containing protein n=1 Tax=Robbsia betulipollinis TaxID=2981849 RepID=A0ABT3ZNC5_9BURK|nr:DUF1656 domain-containing protein [Robbsia betulipollinis]MCY0388044.1 DUF1656 domain-containing protein [Robbsia betulipollinis]
MSDLTSTLPGWLTLLHRWLASWTLPRETSLGGAYVPTLMVVFVGCGALTWLIDLGLARAGAYRFIWHPPLFRISLFVCLLSVAGLALYG